MAAVRTVLADARSAVRRRDAAMIATVSEPLSRTVKMFRGLVNADRADAE
jgi:hypothetical protein